MTEGKTGARLKVLAVLCMFMFAALGTRLWFVQVLATEQYQEQAKRNGTRVVAVPAPRGRILDRNGDVMVGNRGSLVVTVNRQELGDRAAEVLPELASVLGLTRAELQDRLESLRYLPYTPVPVAFDVPLPVALYLGEQQDSFPGVDTETLTVRTYPLGKMAAHVLGTTGQIPEDQLADPRFAGDYDAEDVVGKGGVEETYEAFLRGVEGRTKYRLDSSGRNLGVLGSRAPVQGHSLVLTIDAEIQRLVEESLRMGIRAARHSEPRLPAEAGAALVMDPANGEIVAITSWPTFDPSKYVEQFEELQEPSRHQPLFNRAIQAAYPPGSTFKPFVALSALRRGLTDPEKQLDCPALYHPPSSDNEEDVKANWSPVNMGFMHLSRALVVSCDTVFYQLGFKYWQTYDKGRAVDPNLATLLQTDLEAIGFGHQTGVDVPSESTGIIPDPEWKEQQYQYRTLEDSDRDGYLDDWANNWLPGDFLNMSIGQGDVTVTPLQLASGFSALANGGTVWRPHLALRVEDADGSVVEEFQPEVNGRLPFTKQDLEYVREALRGVVSGEGTAQFAFREFPLDRIPVAAKTGTSERPPHEDDSWFAAMAPANDPEYVVVVVVEQGGHGSQTAAPITRRILQGLFGLTPEPIDVHIATD